MKSGFEGLKGKVTDFTVNGKCSQCGECCSNLLPLSEYEIKRIHQFVTKKNIMPHVNNFPTKSATIDMSCPFRNNKKRICEIYKIRPLICQVFQCNKQASPEEGVLFAREPRILVNMREEFFKEGYKHDNNFGRIGTNLNKSR